MVLSKITIKNYPLLVNAELNADSDITLLVGRNNTAKTSCMNLIEKVLEWYRCPSFLKVQDCQKVSSIKNEQARLV